MFIKYKKDNIELPIIYETEIIDGKQHQCGSRIGYEKEEDGTTMVYAFIKDECSYECIDDREIIELETTEELINELKNNSSLYKDIEYNIQENIRKKYSVNDEFSILRNKDDNVDKFNKYNEYVNNCVKKGNKLKLKIGLGKEEL